jgi:hypothetical protein
VRYDAELPCGASSALYMYVRLGCKDDEFDSFTRRRALHSITLSLALNGGKRLVDISDYRIRPAECCDARLMPITAMFFYLNKALWASVHMTMARGLKVSDTTHYMIVHANAAMSCPAARPVPMTDMAVIAGPFVW